MNWSAVLGIDHTNHLSELCNLFTSATTTEKTKKRDESAPSSRKPVASVNKYIPSPTTFLLLYIFVPQGGAQRVGRPVTEMVQLQQPHLPLPASTGHSAGANGGQEAG